MPVATTRRLLLALTAVMAALLCAPASAPAKALDPSETAPRDFWSPQPERVGLEVVLIPGSSRFDHAIATPTAPGRTGWLSRDPLGEAGGLNLYGFVGNDPINSYDYLGLNEQSGHYELPNGNIFHIALDATGTAMTRLSPSGNPQVWVNYYGKGTFGFRSKLERGTKGWQNVPSAEGALLARHFHKNEAGAWQLGPDGYNSVIQGAFRARVNAIEHEIGGIRDAIETVAEIEIIALTAVATGGTSLIGLGVTTDAIVGTAQGNGGVIGESIALLSETGTLDDSLVAAAAVVILTKGKAADDLVRVGDDFSIAPGTGGRAPIFADNNVLVAAERGNAAALAEIRAGQTFVTPNQLREFINPAAIPGHQLATRRALLQAEGIKVYGGSSAAQAAAGSNFQNIFRATAGQHGRADAALGAFARETGFEAVTMERRITNFFNLTRPELQVPIRRVTP